MEKVCLMVDLDSGEHSETWEQTTQEFEFAIPTVMLGCEEAKTALAANDVVMIVIFVDKNFKVALDILEVFNRKVAAIPHFQGIVCSDPDPFFISDTFEFGVDIFISHDNWGTEVANLTQSVKLALDDAGSAETQTITINRAIASGDQKTLSTTEGRIAETAEYDYIAAYTRGNALIAAGKYSEALDAFSMSRKMNKFFRPSLSSIGENLLIAGNVDKALEIFQTLEQQNPRNLSRKVNLVATYLEKGDLQKAEEYSKQAESLAPGHPKIAEAKVQILLSKGKIGEAFKLMDQLQDVGPFFAAKLNESGIKLSQQGKGKSALALYAKAHKCVKKELQFKISLNAALACYRLQEFQKGLKYLERCEKEYGKTYEKIEKIRQALQAGMRKKQSKEDEKSA